MLFTILTVTALTSLPNSSVKMAGKTGNIQSPKFQPYEFLINRRPKVSSLWLKSFHLLQIFERSLLHLLCYAFSNSDFYTFLLDCRLLVIMYYELLIFIIYSFNPQYVPKCLYMHLLSRCFLS